jgi:HIRAN domain
MGFIRGLLRGLFDEPNKASNKPAFTGKTRLTPRGYPVGIVGESNYQTAIKKCREGEAVTLLREPGNPHDQQAIVVVSARDETIGYVSRDSFVRGLVHEQEAGCDARILSIGGDGQPFLGVVIDVVICDQPIGQRVFRPD